LATANLNQKQETLCGVVEALYHSGANFSAGRLRTSDGTVKRFAGKVFVRENEPVSLRGHWEQHPTYGPQFVPEGIEAQAELDETGLANYLAHHPDAKGIGPAKATAIARAFGKDFDRTIREQPDAVARVAQISFEAALNLQQIWVEAARVNGVLTHLAAYDLTHFQITTLVERFGNDVVKILEADPYLLIREIPGFGFKRVDKIARRLGTPKELPSRLRAGLLYLIQEALDNGDCWVNYEDLLDRANTLLVLDSLDSRQLIEEQLEALIREEQLVCCPHERLVVADPAIHAMEESLAGVFRHAAARNPHGGMAPAWLQFEPLTEDQRAAVRNALTYSISLMTGGAGSGKTYTIKSIIKVCDEFGLSYEIAAPTGKAAKRMEHSTQRPAQTVHRLLGSNGHHFAKGPLEPIETDFLLVDEVSMIDVPLMYQLFSAINLQRTAVLLVGDHNQLPPVGPGNVLRDLIQSRAIPTTVLTKIIRQAGVLKENSTAILDGIVRPTCGEKTGRYRPWYIVNNFTERDHVGRFLEMLFAEVLTERLGFDLIRDVQVLTPTHKGPLGTVALNIALQRLIQRKLYGVAAPEVKPGSRPRLLPGDKVIQTRNDYGLGVMNGALGFVVTNDLKLGLAIDFEGEIVSMGCDSVQERHIQLAYATSIHKMQGSEFPCVVIILHKSHSFMHHRNLLYTAVTRAQESVIVLGDRWGIVNCARTQKVDTRNTFLSFLLDDPRRPA
jgi:exodeoxyribonuclease V alpha subunit